MRLRVRLFCLPVIIICLFVAQCLRAEDNPLNDPDLQQLLKQAQEMQKNARELQKDAGSRDARKNLADLEATAEKQGAQQEQEEKREKEKLQAALKEQLDAPGPVTLPDWTPTTPEFKPSGKPAKKDRKSVV